MIIPQQNVPDLAEVDQVVKDHVQFVPVRRIDEVLPLAIPSLVGLQSREPESKIHVEQPQQRPVPVLRQ